VTPALLVISGAVGVGKTATGYEVATLLQGLRIPHTFVDFDALSDTWPVPDDDRWNTRLALANLRSIWRNCATAGSRNLVVAQVVETATFRDELIAAVAADPALLVRLRASEPILHERVVGREHGRALAWHLARSSELAEQYEHDDPADVVVDTDGRSVIDVAHELLGLIDWR
jgi:hypothetical protein